ncbi:MAG: DUF3473 domain-containing protein [Desulfobacterium sp.]
MTDTILLTVDVEDWFQVENFKPWISRSSWNGRELRVEQNCHRLLDLFEGVPGVRVRATFFILGWIAERLPGLVQEIVSRGHEVASHGVNHELCTSLSPRTLFNDLDRSRKVLEDLIGVQVLGYRAPSFAISNQILSLVDKAGYAYDASYNSFEHHGRYGKIDIRGKPRQGIAIEINGHFRELPVSNLNLSTHTVPLGGGGYFRLFPFLLWQQGVHRILAREGVYHFYMHPWEVDPDQPRVRRASAGFRFRHYVNLGTTSTKLSAMIKAFDHCKFATCSQYLGRVLSEGYPCRNTP